MNRNLRLCMYKAIMFFLCVIFLLSIIPSTPAMAASNEVLPLPESGTYNVTVLARYSNGAGHASYISQYILGQGAYANPCRICIFDWKTSKN